jgi:hypothetical protein
MRWVLRLIATEGDARCLGTDLIEICRPEGLGDIANLGLNLGGSEAASGERSTSGRFRTSRQPWAAAAVLLSLRRKIPPEGLAGTPHRDAVWCGDGAASQVSMHRLQSHRDERWLAIALPINT